MEYLYVFDYSVVGIYEYKIDNMEDVVNMTTLLSEKGHNENNCTFMWSDTKLDIITNNG